MHAAITATPEYVTYYDMEGVRGPLGRAFAKQVLATCNPFLAKPVQQLRVLDVGCGYGHTARELSRECESVLGIEPVETVWKGACIVQHESGLQNLEFQNRGIYDLAAEEFDLIVLDNVLEHLPDQQRALNIVGESLAPGGAAFILVPNKLWPLEVHYGLPFLSYLPLSMANSYLRLSGRGTDYQDASYAPTYFRLWRMLRSVPGCEFQFVLPADLSLATRGAAWHYRVGVAAIRRFPLLWSISKAFLVVLRKGG